jgi:DNA-binding HxlR family transcriptional regulator
MRTPKAGTKARGSQTGRPIMAILDLLGRRWALRILWELHQSSPNSFRALQKLCGDISPTILNSRLKELREAGIIGLRDGEGYFITGQGVALGRIITQLNTWAKGWARRSSFVPNSRPTLAALNKSAHQISQA